VDEDEREVPPLPRSQFNNDANYDATYDAAYDATYDGESETDDEAMHKNPEHWSIP